MARYVSYYYQGVHKKISFSYSKHFDIFEAVAEAEGVDLKNFWAMEKQLEMASRGQGIMKNYRANEFESMGFSEITLLKDEQGENN